MKAPLRPRRFGLDVNLTPLIDVVFNLVIFFLVASHFARSEVVETVDLPTATQVSQEQDPPRRLLITILPDGTYHTGGHELTLDDIEVILANEVGDDPATYAVHLRGDRTVHFESVQKLMHILPQYGITNFGFKVREQGE